MASRLRDLWTAGRERRADSASQALTDADDAARSAHSAADAADTRVDEAVSEAVRAGLSPEALLLDKHERRVAAGVNEEQPFGVPSPSRARRGPFGLGFLATAGALTALLGGLALREVEHQLILVLIAAFIAIGLDPAVRFLQRRGLSRGPAVAVVSVIAFALLVGFLAAIAAPLTREANALIDATPGYLDQLKDENSTLGRLNAQLHLTEKAQQLADQGVGSQTAGSLLSVGSRVASGIFDTVIVLVLIVYFLADLPRITAAAYRLAPRHRRPRVGLLGDAIIARVGGYVLGNVATSFIAFVFAYVALLILGVPSALVLAVVIGVLDLVPLVGSTIGGAIAALVALAAVSTGAAIAVVVFTLVYRLLADYAINPVVLRRTVDVSPLVTVVAVLIGGGLLGIVGALIAVPTAAAIQLIITEVIYPQRDADVVAAEPA